MAVKWHPKKDGSGVGKCTAKNTCPNGGDSEHFATKKEALAHVEAQAAQDNASAGNGSFPSGITKRSADDCQDSSALKPKALEQARNKVSAMEPSEKVKAARNKKSSAETLAVLAEDIDRWVRAYAASNTNTSKELLTVLGRDGDRVVREAVAENRRTPSEVLITLAEDDYWQVREAVSGNKSTPVGVLTTLAKDKNYWVRRGVAKNPSTDPDVLVSLSHDTDEDVSLAAQHNPSLPLSRILELAHHRYARQRIRIVDNPSLPYENLLLMLNDSSKVVRGQVEEVLRKRNDSARVD